MALLRAVWWRLDRAFDRAVAFEVQAQTNRLRRQHAAELERARTHAGLADNGRLGVAVLPVHTAAGSCSEHRFPTHAVGEFLTSGTEGAFSKWSRGLR